MTTLIEAPKRGEVLNTCILLDVKISSGGDMYGLFLNPENKYHPFVTWWIGNDGSCDISKKYDGTGFCHGHYLETLEEAVEDLKERAGK